MITAEAEPIAPETKAAPTIGRPPLYTKELGEKICFEIADGATLRRIEEMPGMPSRRSVLRWLAVDPDFREMYEAAHLVQAEDDLEELQAVLKAVSTKSKSRIAIERDKLCIATMRWIIEQKKTRAVSREVAAALKEDPIKAILKFLEAHAGKS